MELNESFILVVIQDERGHVFNFTKPIRDNWTLSVLDYQKIGMEMVKDWIEIGYVVKAIVLVDKNYLFSINKII